MRAEALHRLAADLAAEAGHGGTFMEVCGTHTMAIARYGLRSCCRHASAWSPAPAARSA